MFDRQVAFSVYMSIYFAWEMIDREDICKGIPYKIYIRPNNKAYDEEFLLVYIYCIPNSLNT